MPPSENASAVAWIDRHGDIWTTGTDGLMHTYETAPFARAHVEKKWGPLRPISRAALDFVARAALT